MDYTRFSILILLLTITAINVLCQNNDLTVELDSFEASKKYDTKFIDWNTLQMKKVGRNKFVISGTFKTNLNMGNEQKLNLQVYTYDAERKQRGPLLFNVEKEICNFIAEDEYIYPGLKEVSNLPDRDVCPMAKGDYTIKDYELKADILPPDTPKGDYLIMSKLKDGTTTVAVIEIYVTVS